MTLQQLIGLLGYTLCSGIICEELNGSDYAAIPYEADPENPNPWWCRIWTSRKPAGNCLK